MVWFPQLVLLGVGIALASPLKVYNYTSGGQVVRTGNPALPVKFNGVPIHTVELPKKAKAGTLHHISEGHHFYHADWILTNKNGGSWEFRPGRKKSLVSRQGNAESEMLFQLADMDGMMFAGGFQMLDEELISVSSITNGAFSEASELLYSWDAPPIDPNDILNLELLARGAEVFSTAGNSESIFNVVFDVIAGFFDID